MSGRHRRKNTKKGNDKRKSVKRKFKKPKNRKELYTIWGSKYEFGVK